MGYTIEMARTAGNLLVNCKNKKIDCPRRIWSLHIVENPEKVCEVIDELV